MAGKKVIPETFAALVDVAPKDWLLPSLEVAAQRLVNLNPNGDGRLYLDGEIAAENPVKSRDALLLWFDRMPWTVIDPDGREEAMRHLAAEEPGLFLGSMSSREVARFIGIETNAINTGRNRSGDHPEGFDYRTKRYRFGRLAALRWAYRHLKARAPVRETVAA